AGAPQVPGHTQPLGLTIPQTMVPDSRTRRVVLPPNTTVSAPHPPTPATGIVPARPPATGPVVPPHPVTPAAPLQPGQPPTTPQRNYGNAAAPQQNSSRSAPVPSSQSPRQSIPQK